MEKQVLQIGDLVAKQGEKIQGMVAVYDTGFSFPVTLINGKKSGKCVLLTGGVHGAEYPGIQTTIELAKELTPEEVEGQLIIIHPVNVGAFNKKVCNVVPMDNKNLNRIFPGDKEGTLAEQIAYFITHECQAKAEFYIDLHGGDLHEQATNFVYYPGIAEPEVTAAARNIAATLDVKYMVKSGATTGSYTSAALRGLPGILIERGGRGSWTREEVVAYKKDIKAALHALGLLKDKALAYVKEVPTQDITKAIYLESEIEGCWYPEVSAGDQVEKGQLLGTIKDFFGNTLETYYAEESGVILYMTIALAIGVDEPLIAYGLC